MDFLLKLLDFYNLSENDLKKREKLFSLEDLSLPYNYPNFQKVIKRIKTAINNKEKIIIYGDYDLDGIASTTIMKRCFDYLKVDCGFFIPSRYHEGYGLNKSRIDDFYKKGYKVIITVDNGITAFEEVSYARKLGFDVIIIDHHNLSDSLPDSEYIFHQQIDKFINYNCSAASLAFFVSSFLKNRFDEYDVILAGMAVLSDVMPLENNNLILLRNALKNINAGFASNLLKLIYPNKLPIDFDTLSYVIIPLLNAPGRIKTDSLSTNNVCRFLLDNNISEKNSKYAKDIIDCQNDKKKIIKDVKVKDSLSNDYASIYLLDSLSGMTGLFANMYLKKENKTFAVFIEDENDKDILVGSIRSLDNVSLLPLLNNPKSYILNIGGHKNAIGLKIMKKDYLKFATDLTIISSMNKKEDNKKYIEISIDDLTNDNYQIYKRFEPFSYDFIKPTFKVTTSLENFKKYSTKMSSIVSRNNFGKITYFGNFENEDDKEDIFEFTGELKYEVYYSSKHWTLISSSYLKIDS